MTYYITNFRTTENASFFFGRSDTYGEAVSLIEFLTKGFIINRKVVDGTIYKVTTEGGSARLEAVASVATGTFIDEFGEYFIKVLRIGG